MAGPDEVVVKHRKGAVGLYLVLMAGYLAYCIVTLVTTFKKLDNPPISSTNQQLSWNLPALFIGPSERYAPDFTSQRFFARCVFQESHFALGPDFKTDKRCTGGRCFCTARVVDHPNDPSKKRVGVDLSSLVAKHKGASVEIYMEFPKPTKVVCPTISQLLNQGADVALPIVCDRTMITDLYSRRMFDEAVANKEAVEPQGKMATTASSPSFPMNNKFWIEMSQIERYVRDESYFSGAPTAQLETEDSFDTTGYSEHLSFDSTHVNYLEANNLDFMLLTVKASSVGVVVKHKELSPMDWTILLGQLGGFWVVVTILFRIVYVPKAYMVPRWKKTEADLEDEMNAAHTEKLWEGAVRRKSQAQPGAAYPLTPAQRVTSYPPKGNNQSTIQMTDTA
ncbi:hypothetical protein HOP50_03g21310 [Chloropicon primus]|uniref:Uncharacterized protein n=1 Tax=Chloropicon primus TaxID=1764295 RepID=A0A5B8MGQ8_9CHLO|nr:hypothetical protein A3770_03p21310 [Chloropicon primus]UPQ98825.1 hypothetical protein HOP50_03g21310 [Chloropicon primus]|eukprot:QDZ19613.1 hypothetical protein A3770_03p21310 [Chloropicon primus]